MQLGRKDLIWTYAAVSMRMISGAFIMPFSLRLFPSEELGVWQIFLQFMTITALLDFGFANSFARNVTYVFSGAKELRATGFETAEGGEVDYGLLKSLLRAMRFFYGVLAVIFLVVFSAGGSLYLYLVLQRQDFTGDTVNVWAAWLLFGFALAYELYTYYYNSILNGRGWVKMMQKITVLAHSVRIVVTITLLLVGLKLLALVIGMIVSDLISRTLANRAFYDSETRRGLAASKPSMEIRKTIRILAPNAFKIGIMGVGVFLKNKVTVLIAAVFMPLPVTAAYGISRQIIEMIGGLGSAWWGTFYPQATQYTVQNRKNDLKRLYIKATGTSILVMAVLGAAFVIFGDTVVEWFKNPESPTCLLNGYCLAAMLIFTLLDNNQAISSGFLLIGNQVPFWKSNLAAGVLAVLFLWLMLQFTTLGVWSLILSVGLSMSLYLFWKWPFVVIRNLQIKMRDVRETVQSLFLQAKIN